MVLDMVKFMDYKEREGWTTEEANIQMVLWEGIRLIKGRIPKDVRAALNTAVKGGRLGHMKKSGLKPEAFYRPDFERFAEAERIAHKERTERVVNKVLAGKRPAPA